MASSGVSRIEGIDPFVAIKAPCKVATTANITLSGAQTVDGVAVAETTPKTRVLVRSQTSAVNNGAYDVYDTAWVRCDDFNGSRDVVEGTLIGVTDGTTYGLTTWKLVGDNPIVFGTSSINFSITNDLASNVTTVPTFAALASTPATVGQVVKFTCHTNAGDLGGGDAEAYAATHAATDGGLSINSVTTGVRFRRINYNFVTPEMFGVNTSNAGAGFTAALAAGVNKFVARGTYTISTSVVVPDNIHLDLRGAIINQTFTGKLFDIGSDVRFYYGEIVGASYAYRSGQYGIYCAGTRNGAGVAPTRKNGPRIYGTKFTNVGDTAIELRYTTGGSANNVEIYNGGYVGISGLSSTGFKVFNLTLDGLTGETGSGQLNAYGVTFTHDNLSTDLVRDPVSSYCSVNGVDIKNIKTWHALDTHAGSNISFRNGRISNCRRAAILTYTAGAGPSNCEICDIEAINTLATGDVNSNGTSVHAEAFWVVGSSSKIASNNLLKNLTSVGHGTYDSTLGSYYLTYSDRTRIINCGVISGYHAGMKLDAGNTLLDIDGFYVNEVAANNVPNIVFGITSTANDVTGTAKNLNIKGVAYGVYSTSATSGMTVLSGEVTGATYDYNVSSVWTIHGHKERGSATVTFTAANNATQAVTFTKIYKNSPKITGMVGQYEAGGVPVSLGYSALSNLGLTIRGDTTTAASVTDTMNVFWEVEGD